MRAKIKDAADSFRLIDEHPADFTSPELFYWNTKNQIRATLAKLQPLLKP